MQNPVFVFHLDLIGVFLRRGFTGLWICHYPVSCPLFFPCSDLNLLPVRQLVLRRKQFPQSVPDFLPRIVLIENRQIGSQNIGIMVNIGKIKLIFVIAGMRRLYAVNLCLQVCFHRLIVTVSTPDICILCCICATENTIAGSCPEHRTGRERTGDQQKDQSQNAACQQHPRMFCHKLLNACPDVLKSLG